MSNEPQKPAVAQRTAKFDPSAHGLKTGIGRQKNLHDEALGLFYVNPDLIPEGWTVEWKTLTINGMPDPQNRALGMHVQNGWQPAPRSIFKSVDPNGTSQHIEKGGQMLMMREKHLTDEARLEDRKRAIGALRDKEAQLGMAPSGGFERKASITKSWESGVIPD